MMVWSVAVVAAAFSAWESTKHCQGIWEASVAFFLPPLCWGNRIGRGVLVTFSPREIEGVLVSCYNFALGLDLVRQKDG